MKKIDPPAENVEVPLGKRFSHVYQKRGEPVQDSARMRRRISALVENTHGFSSFSNEVEKELGIPVGARGWHHFFANCALSDLLDCITIAYRHLWSAARRDHHGLVKPDAWVPSIRRIFAEENIHYTVDDHGGVHFAFDSEFDRNRASAIDSLRGQRYANVLAQFEEVDARLAESPPNGKGAIRATFSAAEGLFRLVFSAAPRLASSEIDKYLPPVLQRVYAGDPTALRAASKVIASFKEWVDAAHFYRHESGKEDIAQPPLDLAMNLISLGTSYIRWLAEIDAVVARG